MELQISILDLIGNSTNLAVCQNTRNWECGWPVWQTFNPDDPKCNDYENASESQWQCRLDNFCIPKEMYKNFIKDCYDNTDESCEYIFLDVI